MSYPLKGCLMFLAHSMKCTECRRDMGAAISATTHRDILHTLEFICAMCADKITKSEAASLDSETSWGKVIAKIKGR